MVTSLFSVPQFQQGRFQTFASQAKVLNVLLYLLSGSVPVLDQKGECPPAVKRGQRLDDMVPADDSLMIRSSKFVDGAGPELVAITKILFFRESGNPLQLGQRRRRENRLEYGFQFSHSGAEHGQEPLAIYAQRLQSHFLFSAQSGDRL